MERWSKTLNTRLARGSAMAWYSVDERLLTIRLTPKIAQPVTCQPSPRRAACTTITTRAATDSAEAMPEVMLLATSSPRVYSLPTTERAADAAIDRIIPGAVRLVTRCEQGGIPVPRRRGWRRVSPARGHGEPQLSASRSARRRSDHRAAHLAPPEQRRSLLPPQRPRRPGLHQP